MLTGQPAEATLKAIAPVTTYELAKEDLAPVFEARPEVSHELCRALARRQAAGQLIASADIDKTVPPRRVAAWSRIDCTACSISPTPNRRTVCRGMARC